MHWRLLIIFYNFGGPSFPNHTSKYNCKHRKNIILLHILESIFIGFDTFLTYWDLPGASWSLLGPPLEIPSQIWTTKEGPRVAPRGSWGGFWVDLGLLWGPLNIRFGKIFDTFLVHVLQEAPKPVLGRILHEL